MTGPGVSRTVSYQSTPPPGYKTPPGFGAPPAFSGPPAYVGYQKPTSSSGRTVFTVVGTIAIVIVLLIGVLIAAVVLLGSDSEKNASSIGAAGSGGAPVVNATTTAPVWSVWKAPDNSFTIEFPGMPAVTVDSVDEPSNGPRTTASVDLPTSSYLVTYLELKPGYYFPDASKTLQEAVDQFTSGTAFAIDSRDDTAFAGIPAVHLVGHHPVTNDSAQMEVLVSGKRVYRIIAVGNTPSSYDFERFLGSFHITA